MSDKNNATGVAPGISNVEVIEIPASFADFALACGMAHDASKGDVLAKMATLKNDVATAKSDALVAQGSLAKVLDFCGAKTADEAIGKLTAKDSVIASFVKAITGDENATEADALAKLESDRQAAESSKAQSLIEKAAAEGKTAGPKALELFQKYGMAALEAHLDALVPHVALTTKPPTQRQEEGGAKPAVATEGEVVLTEDDKRFCEKNGISEEAFLAARKDELATINDNKRRRDG